MSKMRCYNCGHIFNEEDAEQRFDNVGEFWGAPAYMGFSICPKCNSDEIEEVEDEQ